MTAPSSTRPSAPDPAADQLTLRELLRDRAFTLYLIGQATSGGGSALSAIALVFAVLSVSRSASSLGVVLLASRLPPIALTLTGGVIADRFSRQRIATGCDVARTVLQTATGALLVCGDASVAVLVGLQVLAGVASALFTPAAGALIAEVAPDGQIRRAGSALAATIALTQTGGLAVSGVLVALAGAGTSFLIDGATFGVSSLSLMLMPRIEPVGRVPRAGGARELLHGWRVVTSYGWLKVCMTHETLVNVLALCPFFVLGPLVAEQHLGGAPAWSAIALGYVLGTLAAGHITYYWVPRRPVFAALTLSTMLIPLLALLAIDGPIWLIAPAAALAGGQTTIYNTLSTSALQSNLPSEILGRATAIVGIGSTLLVPIGMGLAGTVAAAVGTRAELLGAAAAVLIVTAACAPTPAARTPLGLDASQLPT